MLRTRIFVGVFWVGSIALGVGMVLGQDYPSKPIRIFTAPAGGGSDLVTRLIAQGVSGPLGQPVIIDNRAGVIPGQLVSQAPPDGYTLLVATNSLWVGPLLEKTPYDAVRDFSPITLLGKAPNVLVVHPSLPIKSVKELVVLAKAKPGELDYASGVTGSSSHLAGELFKSMVGVNIVRIPYKGNGPAVTALMGGQVQLTFGSVGTVIPHAKSGRLRTLAITSDEPSALFPGLPTVAASGVPGYELVGVDGILAPAKTPVTIINRLNQEVVRFLNTAEAKERFLSFGAEAVNSSAEEFAAKIRSEVAKMGKLIKDADIRL